MTCSSYQRIIQFTGIPSKCSLSTRIGRTHFTDYMSNILAKPEEYRFLSGWVTHKKSHSSVSSYLQRHDCVASQQYSPNCKVFIFLVNFLKPDWLRSVAIYTTTPKIELMFFLVHKKKGETETALVPQNVPLTVATAFRFVHANNKIGLKPTTIDRIREYQKPDAVASFGEGFAEEDDEPAKQEKQKSANKLQFLIDKGDQIKKVPTFLIEEEARNERQKTNLAHFEEESVDDDDDEVDIEPKGFGFSGSYMNSAQKKPDDKPTFMATFGSGNVIDKEEFARNAVSQIQVPIQTILAATRYIFLILGRRRGWLPARCRTKPMEETSVQMVKTITSNLN